MKISVIFVVLAFGLAACGSDESATTAPAANSTVSPALTTDAVTTTAVTTTASTASTAATTTTTAGTMSTAATTVSPSTTTGEPCVPPTDIEPVSVDYPMGMSSLVGRDIRTGAHSCFERVVLELQGTGEMPGYRVQYVDDPVKLSPSDIEVDIAGDATLVLSVAVWMTTMEGDGYDGPDRIVPTNVDLIEELRLIENFEGMHQWAIGLDRERPFSVTTLNDPPRIVIDIAS